jgi:hypothetical protein
VWGVTVTVTKNAIPVTISTSSVTHPVMPRGITLCPHCHHPMITDQVGADLPALSRRIYELVRDAGQVGISSHDLADRAYVSKRHGRPETNSVSVLISQRINPLLAAHGVKLMSRGGPGSVYRLVKRP